MFKECDFIWSAAKYFPFNLIHFNDISFQAFQPGILQQLQIRKKGALKGRFCCKHWHALAQKHTCKYNELHHAHPLPIKPTHTQARTCAHKHTQIQEHQKEFLSSSEFVWCLMMGEKFKNLEQPENSFPRETTINCVALHLITSQRHSIK